MRLICGETWAAFLFAMLHAHRARKKAGLVLSSLLCSHIGIWESPAPEWLSLPEVYLFQRLRLAGGKIGLDLTQLI